MQVEFINPFYGAAANVIQMMVGQSPERGGLSARPQLYTSQQVNVVCGVTGQVEGLVIYSMSLVTAQKIAGTMIGQPVNSFDQLAASAIAELSNMISGNAISGLAAAGFISDITPPTIIRGTNVKVSTLNIPSIVIPFTLEGIGNFEVNVSLQMRKTAAAA